MTTAPKHPWLEPDDEFEGVGAHRDNPRFDMEVALADVAAAAAVASDEYVRRNDLIEPTENTLNRGGFP